MYYNENMRILGIDPGVGRLGWGVIEEAKTGTGWRAVAYGCIETEKNTPLPKRIQDVYDNLVVIIQKHAPNVLSVEELFFSKNVTTAFMVGQARGVVLLVASQNNLEVVEYNPGTVKLAVTGYGRADKRQITQMVKTIFKLPKETLMDDTADALAVALAHAFSRKSPKIKKV